METDEQATETAAPDEAPETLEADAPQADAEAGESPEPAGPAEPLNPVADLDPVADLTQRLQRVSAEFANYQKRIQRDRAKWTRDAVRDVIVGMLPTLDTLEQAIGAFSGEVKKIDAYREGVELVHQGLLRHLGSFEFSPIAAEVGSAFDADAHQAIMAQEDEEVEAEQIAFVARTGYRLGDVVLRPTQVGVKKPKAS